MLRIYRSRNSAFTLVHLLIIIVVVVILAGIAAPRLLKQQEKSRRTSATNDIDALGLALDIYASHSGMYPSAEQGLKALWEKPIISPIPSKWQVPYMTKPILKDPWGNSYVYVYPGVHNKNDYDLLSYGKDGMIGGKGDNEDIVNWTEEE